MQNDTLQNEINELIKNIKGRKMVNKVDTKICETQNIDKLEFKINNLLKLYNIKIECNKLTSIEDIENEISNIFRTKKIKDKSLEKCYTKLYGFYTSRKAVVKWDANKIDEFFSSLMK